MECGRGREGRANLHLLPTGEMVYPMAAIVVLLNWEEHTQRHYLGHTEVSIGRCVKLKSMLSCRILNAWRSTLTG